MPYIVTLNKSLLDFIISNFSINFYGIFDMPLSCWYNQSDFLRSQIEL